MRQSILDAKTKNLITLGKHIAASSMGHSNKQTDPTPKPPPMNEFDQLRHDALGAQDRRSNLIADGAPKKYPSL